MSALLRCSAMHYLHVIVARVAMLPLPIFFPFLSSFFLFFVNYNNKLVFITFSFLFFSFFFLLRLPWNVAKCYNSSFYTSTRLNVAFSNGDGGLGCCCSCMMHPQIP
jgi:hypothetical protein